MSEPPGNSAIGGAVPVASLFAGFAATLVTVKLFVTALRYSLSRALRKPAGNVAESLAGPVVFQITNTLQVLWRLETHDRPHRTCLTT